MSRVVRLVRGLAAVLRRERGGASAAEFALVAPLIFLFLFGIIDVGRYAWAINQLEKATQVGVRHAVATAIVPQGLNAYDFSNSCPGGALHIGDRICREALGTISCSASAGAAQCRCVAGACTSGMIGTVDAAAFNRIVTRMQIIAPDIATRDVTVSYSGSGVGFLGDPATDEAGNPLSDVAPVVTVAVSGARMRFLSLLGGSLVLPGVHASLILEDGVGAIAY
ncbi:TadE family protein [Novosphingobium bradum]|uniref:TadE family protein n=1 Tax=Novosphingobium bradum TaxID=1737444 RepID=A0ABV7IT79_9SPHN